MSPVVVGNAITEAAEVKPRRAAAGTPAVPDVWDVRIERGGFS
jgi:hypothetical protein